MKKWCSTDCFVQKLVSALVIAFFLPAILEAPKLYAGPVEEAAAREGKVVFYCGMVAPDVRALAEGFNKKYPNIKVEHYRASESKILEKLLTEKRSGKTFADVLHMAGIWTNVYKKEGLLKKYVSPEAKSFPRGFSDPEGFWTTYYSTYLTFIYNTRMVAKKDLPFTFEGLLDPRWKGKIGIYNDEFEWYMGMLEMMGEEKGKQFMGRLADQDLVLRGGRTLISTLLVAGEFPLALGAVHRTLAQQQQKAPVDLIPLKEPAMASMRTLGVHANAPHPNAARLLVDFILSKEGQAILNRLNRHPVRSDIPVEPVVDALRKNLFPVGPRDPEKLHDYKKEYEKILLKRSI